MSAGDAGSSSGVLDLDGIEVRPSENAIVVAGREKHLEPKIMAVLQELMAHPGEVVTRTHLMDTVWAGRVVGEEALTRCISELRSALGDAASHPEFIQTVPKKGYRLLKTPSASPTRDSQRRFWGLAAAAVLSLTAALALWSPEHRKEHHRIAVLPFEAGTADRHLGTGVAEELMNTLVGIPELRVSSRTAAFSDPGGSDPREIGAKLDVDALLMGAIRRTESGFRLSVQLIDAESGDHLWTDSFEGPESSLYAMEDEIIAAVAERLALPLATPLKVARATADINARDFYLLGRHHWHERSPEGLNRAVRYFQQAIESDPTMAEAYSGLADAYLLQVSYGNRADESAIALAEPLVAEALALDPASADAHASRGILLQNRGDYAGAEAALAEAVALNPYHSMAHMWRGNAVMALGRLEDAFQHYAAAFALDPQHVAVTHNYVHTMIELGRHQEAREILDARPLEEKNLRRMAAQLALQAADWSKAESIATAMEDDPVGAELLRWRLDLQRQHVNRAETHLARAIRTEPDDERVYLAALEHRTVAPGAYRFAGVIEHWADREELTPKIGLMSRAWEAIDRVRRGENSAAATELVTLLHEFDERYPPVQLKLMSHLLIALEGSGQLAAYDRWRENALAASAAFSDAGWASFEFQLERGYLLAAAGEAKAAAASFREAGLMGDLSSLRLSGDPRTAEREALLADLI